MSRTAIQWRQWSTAILRGQAKLRVSEEPENPVDMSEVIAQVWSTFLLKGLRAKARSSIATSRAFLYRMRERLRGEFILR